MRRILGEYQVTVNSVGEQDDHVDSLEDDGAEPGCDHRRPVRARVQTPKDLPSSSPTIHTPKRNFSISILHIHYLYVAVINMFL